MKVSHELKLLYFLAALGACLLILSATVRAAPNAHAGVDPAVVSPSGER